MLQQKIVEKINNNTYLGYTDVFKKSFYTEEEHSHKFNTTSLSPIIISNEMYDVTNPNKNNGNDKMYLIYPGPSL